LRRGVETLRRRDPARASAPEAWLEELVSRFGDRILPVTTEIADRWGHLGIPGRPRRSTG
jgi:predicted nucleic acid-binding protein